VDWKNAALLRKFISDRGQIRARRVTGLTPRQRQVAAAIKMALLPYPGSSRA
jgi:small subunit ribosomal protein S18